MAKQNKTKLNTRLQRDPKVTLLGIYPEEVKTDVHKNEAHLHGHTPAHG